MPTLQLRRTSLFWFQGAWELGRVFGGELFCFCLFVFQLPRWVIILFLSLTSGWGFLLCLFVCFCLFVFVLCCFSFKMFNFPTIYLGSGWYLFYLFIFIYLLFIYLFIYLFFVSPVGKVFCFLLFLFVFISFCFVLFCFLLPKIPTPWYQMVRPYPYSITQMMVDITSSTILNSRAIQWKI